MPAYIRPLFCRGIGPFRWAALSGDPEDIYRTDAKVKELLPDNAHLHNWLDMARERIAFQGLPARICWVGLGDRHRLGLAFNEMVAIRRAEGADRDRPRSSRFRLGRLAQPRDRGDADGSDAVSDWPLLNALLNTASGATWVSLHHGGGVGMGFSQHAGMVIVCRRQPRPPRRIARVLWNDPGHGVMRHADAGYEIAIDCARENQLDLPGILAPELPVRRSNHPVDGAAILAASPGKCGIVAVEAGAPCRIGRRARPPCCIAAAADGKLGKRPAAVAATMPVPSSTASSAAGSITVQPAASA